MRRIVRSTLAICSTFQCSDASRSTASSVSRLASTPRTRSLANAATSGVAALSAAWYCRTSSGSSDDVSSWNSTRSASSRAWCLLPEWLRWGLDGLAGKRDAGDEDVHLADLETKHPLRRLDDVALHRAGDRRELRLRVDRDEDLQVDRAVGLDLHAHTAVSRLPPDPVSEMPSRCLVHARYAFDLAGGHRRDAGDHLVGNTYGSESGGLSHPATIRRLPMARLVAGYKNQARSM